jgi:hypothetical protein
MTTAEYFAGGCSFIDFESIRASQLTAAFLAHLNSTRFNAFCLPAENVTHQNPHRWLPIPAISMLWQMSSEQKTHLRSVRQQGHDDMSAVFRHWKSMPGRQIEGWKEAELRSGRLADGELLLRNLPNPGLLGHHSSQSLCEAAVEFIQSPAYADVPFVSVYSWLYATAARKAKDTREPPDRGFLRDTETIACLLPYCDAMFVDNMCRAYLNELRSAGRLVFDTRIFSKTNIDDLFNFVDQLENDVAPEVSRLVSEIYRVN